MPSFRNPLLANGRVVAALGIACALAAATSACSKETPPAGKTGAGGPAAQAPGAGRGPAANPAPKPVPSGPLQSRTGTRTARFELLPSGRILVTALAKNRIDPEPIEAAELTGVVMFDGGTEQVKLLPRTGSDPKEPKHSQFMGYSARIEQGLGGTIGVTFPSGEPKIAQFQIPPGYKSY